MAKRLKTRDFDSELQKMTLGEKSNNVEEFDEKSKNHEISKCCKNIGLQKLTFKKMLIIPGRHGFNKFFIA